MNQIPESLTFLLRKVFFTTNKPLEKVPMDENYFTNGNSLGFLKFNFEEGPLTVLTAFSSSIDFLIFLNLIGSH